VDDVAQIADRVELGDAGRDGYRRERGGGLGPPDVRRGLGSLGPPDVRRRSRPPREGVGDQTVEILRGDVTPVVHRPEQAHGHLLRGRLLAPRLAIGGRFDLLLPAEVTRWHAGNLQPSRRRGLGRAEVVTQRAVDNAGGDRYVLRDAPVR
jgi:hypothetical protein